MPGSRKKKSHSKKNKSTQKNKHQGAAGSSSMLTNFVDTCKHAVGCSRGNKSDEGTPEKLPLGTFTEGSNSSSNIDCVGGATSQPDEELGLTQKTTIGDAYDDQDRVEAAKGSDHFVFFCKNSDIYSQWHKSTFKVNGKKFVCAEQYMMFGKAELFGDREAAESILETSDSGKMRKLGRKVKGFSAETWDKHCLQIVKEGNMAKFKQNPKLKKELFHTYPKVLVEASPFDRIWGIGMLDNNPNAWNKDTWDGTNFLGYVITEVRDELMCEEKRIKPEQRQTYIDKLMAAIEKKWLEGTSVESVNQPSTSVPAEDLVTHEGSTRGNTSDDGGGATSQPDEEVLRQEALTRLRQKTTNDDGDASDDQDTVNAEGETDDFVFFWKNQDICSQWHKSTFVVNKQKFVCAEQFMMFCKAELFGDRQAAQSVLRTSDPSKMKKIGRQVKGFSAEWWEKNCLQIVKDGNMAKFKQNPKLKKKLFGTYPKVLVEASPYDSIWGIGLTGNNHLAWDKDTWNGTNYLGYVITEVRDELMCEEDHIKPEQRQTYIDNLMADIEKKWLEGSSVDLVYPPVTSVAAEDPYECAKKQYVYFWKEYDILSQWHDSFFELDSQYFVCAEQYMMYKKAETFRNEYIQQQVLEADHPRKMKALGRELQGRDHIKWQHRCLDVVKRGNIEKFRQNPKLKEYLFSTYPKVLVEASPFDKKWGIGLERTDPRAWDEKTWQGTNFLGFVLTEVRDQLMCEDGFIQDHDKKIYIPLLKTAHCGFAEVDNHYTSDASGFTADTQVSADAAEWFDDKPDVNTEPEGDPVVTEPGKNEGMSDRCTNDSQVTVDMKGSKSADTQDETSQEDQTSYNDCGNVTNFTENENSQTAEQLDTNKDRRGKAEASKCMHVADDDLHDKDQGFGRKNLTNDVRTDPGESGSEVLADNIDSIDQMEPPPKKNRGNLTIIGDDTADYSGHNIDGSKVSGDQKDYKTRIETETRHNLEMLENDDKPADVLKTNKDRSGIAETGKCNNDADDDLHADDQVFSRKNLTDDVKTDPGESGGEVGTDNIDSKDQMEPAPKNNSSNMPITDDNTADSSGHNIDGSKMEDPQDNRNGILSGDQRDCKTQIKTETKHNVETVENDDKPADTLETKDNEEETFSRKETDYQTQTETAAGQNSLTEMQQNEGKSADAVETKDPSKYFNIP